MQKLPHKCTANAPHAFTRGEWGKEYTHKQAYIFLLYNINIKSQSLNYITNNTRFDSQVKQYYNRHTLQFIIHTERISFGQSHPINSSVSPVSILFYLLRRHITPMVTPDSRLTNSHPPLSKVCPA